MAPRLVLAVSVLLLGAILACGEGEEAEPNPEPTAAGTASTSPTPGLSKTPGPTAAADWDTYSDAQFGFSFRYPPDWYLSVSDNGSASFGLHSYDPETAPGISRPIPDDQIKILSYVAEGIYIPLEEWLEEWNGPPPTPTVISTSEIEVGGKTGVRQVSDYDGQRSVSYSVNLGGGRVFVISAVPADSKLWPDFESILASLDLASTP